jgi:transcription-repair coupling factor (superfamily II helicase)
MSELLTPKLKLEEWDRSDSPSIFVHGATNSQWLFLFSEILKNLPFSKKNHILVFKNTEEAEKYFDYFNQLHPSKLFTSIDYSLYDHVIHSEIETLEKFSFLTSIINSKQNIIFTTVESLLQKIPNISFFKNNQLILKKEDIISHQDLAKKLSDLGYVRSETCEEPGTFSKKGEIFDIFPIGSNPIRLHFFDELIEEIKLIDLETQRTIKDSHLEEVALYATPQIVFQEKFKNNLRANIPQFGPDQKEKHLQRKSIFDKLNTNQLFEQFSVLFPLFFEEHQNIFDYLDSNSMISFFEPEQCLMSWEAKFEQLNEEYRSLNQNSGNIIPSPEFYFDMKLAQNIFKTKHIKINSINLDFDSNLINVIKINFKKLSNFLNDQNIFFDSDIHKLEYFKKIITELYKKSLLPKNIYFNYQNESAKNEIEYFIQNIEDIPLKINFEISTPFESFYSVDTNSIYLSELDLFSAKRTKATKKKFSNQDLFAEQLSSMKIGDFVVHRDHGVGIYKGLESISHNGLENDFLILEYVDNDKVYVPVYKLNLVQKYADSETQIKINNLRTNKFEQAKNKARESAKKLAFSLIDLQAKRKLSQGFAFSPPNHEFKEFELQFPYKETIDQINAINDVLDDMQKSSPMDRLICGDVGFGKTEVAMRAAFKAVLDKKQVAVLVPTTVLALQHFNSFKNRFKNFAVNIDFISRFKSRKEINNTIENLNEGKIDIVISTHGILAENVKFKDLGLVIIDEEHRFGVAHKEKLKLLKHNIDLLSMTATPIPRTLQLSFLGLKDFSIIQTPPPNRQSIKTYIVTDEDETIKNAIDKELSRGGQVYIIHNRVNDIEIFAEKIQKLSPKAKIVIGHGQMSETELEKKISAFYMNQYDILIATTIIESGIDIANANTMIIDRADTFGLAQLHQLRGRIGRSERKAYAYLVVPKNFNGNSTAVKRLEAINTYSEVGSGFALASSDLEIRGAGDILGADQSGHIDSIGLELYLELLNDAIREIKGSTRVENKNCEIQTPFAAFIPKKYIEDSKSRLRHYKKLSNVSNVEQIDQQLDEIKDIFGQLPQEVITLSIILKCRIYASELGINLIKVANKSIILNFDSETMNHNSQLRDKIIHFFSQRPKIYKINPDFQIICQFKDEISKETLLEFIKHIAEQIVPC